MKFVLILYVCSMTSGQCPGSSYMPYEFNSHYDCVLAGYELSYKNLKELDKDLVNKERLAIKFECKPIPSI
jgi:hypothetical protein